MLKDQTTTFISLLTLTHNEKLSSSALRNGEERQL